MCLIVDSSKEFEVAKNDIVCYKVLYDHENGFYTTPYQQMRVEIGKQYKNREKVQFQYHFLDLTLNIWPKILTGGAYHSFVELDDAKDEINKIRQQIGGWYDMVVVKCIIPKGSKYMEGIYRDANSCDIASYASDNIIYKEIVFNEFSEQ